jgi:DnaJ-class molecular chaperone
VKKRFRELAKKMHPDTGGTHEGFIALSQAYENFIKNMQK